MEINNQQDIAYLVYLCTIWIYENVELNPDERTLIYKINETACTKMKDE